MAFDLSTILSSKVVRPPRIILLGVEKIGKSCFAAGSDHPIFLPIKGEEGIDDIEVPKVPVCNHINEIFGWLQSLHEGEHGHETVVIDSGSTVEPLVFEESCRRLGSNKDGGGETNNIMKAGGGWGAGFRESLVIWRQITGWLDALRTNRGMASILIGHVTVRRFDDPNGESYDQYQWDIHEKAAALLYRWADSILFCNTKVIVKKEEVGFNKEKKRGIDVGGGNRFLYTQKRPSHPGGGRGAYGHLPYELSLDWANFRDAVAQAMAS
jgi:hypothetical protein